MCSTTTDPEYNIPDLEFEEKNTTRETNISVLQLWTFHRKKKNIEMKQK